jgi:hypothetical protein
LRHGTDCCGTAWVLAAWQGTGYYLGKGYCGTAFVITTRDGLLPCQGLLRHDASYCSTGRVIAARRVRPGVVIAARDGLLRYGKARVIAVPWDIAARRGLLRHGTARHGLSAWVITARHGLLRHGVGDLLRHGTSYCVRARHGLLPCRGIRRGEKPRRRGRPGMAGPGCLSSAAPPSSALLWEGGMALLVCRPR